MNYISILFMILGYLSRIDSEDSEEKDKNLPIAVSVPEERTAGAAVAVPVNNEGLSSEALSELHDLAKNISHSKGIYRQPNKESLDELELRRSFVKKATVASESDALKEILQKFDAAENKLELLQQMEYLVHQYDVAVNFAAGGGIDLIAPLLFSSHDEVVSSAASVIGAAVQSNPTVQNLAKKKNLVAVFHKLLSLKSPQVKSRIIFALSSLLRHFPEAQYELILIGGIPKFAEMLESHQIATKTKLKIINLFSDLAVEQQSAEFGPKDWDVKKIEKFKSSFAYEMHDSNICKIIASFLDLEDYDTHDRVVAAMTSLLSACINDFHTPHVEKRLIELTKIYSPVAGNEDPRYPNIDRDLKEILFSEINNLFIRITEKNSSIADDSKLRTEL